MVQQKHITLKKNTDGYVGYKVAIALVEEDGVAGGQILNDTGGVIDFRGERSMDCTLIFQTMHF